MPTGYTAAIKDGIDFQSFTLDCARNFGACITLRDEPNGGKAIPDAFEPSDYHLRALQEAISKLSELAAMPAEDCEHAAKRDWEQEKARVTQRIEEKRNLLAAYRSMLDKVNAWTPPSPEHEGLKKFMREQIEESIRFDCDTSYLGESVILLSGDQWLARQIASCNKDLDYHKKEHVLEVERTAERTRWVQQLRDSLAPELNPTSEHANKGGFKE